MKKKVLLLLTVLCAAAAWGLPTRVQVLLRLERAVVNVDSLRLEAARLEPRLGQIEIANDKYLTVGYMADSLGDTLNLAPVRQKKGVKLIIVE